MLVTVAMLYPGHSAEDEYVELERRIGGVALPVHHTWEGPTDHDVDALLELGSPAHLEPAAIAARNASPPPDAMMWACTSGSFVYGAARLAEQAGWIRDAAGVPASSTTLAFLAAAEHLGVRSVAVSATYPDAVARHLVDVLTHAGLEIAAVVPHDVPSGEDAGRLGPDRVRELVASAHRPGVDAVLVPDTALHTVALLEELEDRLGCTVLSANQVTAWEGLRLAGWQETRRGLGRLFEAVEPQLNPRRSRRRGSPG